MSSLVPAAGTGTMARSDDWLLTQLPVNTNDGSFFTRFVRIFQTMAESVLVQVDGLEHLLDIDVAPLDFVRHLATWLDLRIVDASLDEAMQRDLVRQAGDVLAWRGTRRGLVLFLGLVCGTTEGVDVTDSGWVAPARDIHDPGGMGRVLQPRADLGVGGTVDVVVPNTGWMSAEDFVEVLGDELPAEVCFTVTVGGRRLWPDPEEDL